MSSRFRARSRLVHLHQAGGKGLRPACHPMHVFLESPRLTGVVDVVADDTSRGSVMLALGLLAAIAALLIQRRVRRRAERAAAERVRQMTAVMADADYLFWEAEVVLQATGWSWNMDVYPSGLCRRLFGEHAPTRLTGLWNQFAIGEREAMDRRARQAMESGETGYVQEFKAARAGRIFWMREQVSIVSLGAGRYRLFGLVTDVTARHQSNPGLPEGELTTERILEHAQCLLWRATVIREGESLRWAHFDIPQSQFSDLLFGDRVYSPERGFWEGMKLPD